ncbi:hypothetical protein MCUN1_002376 [Malassezia cuniculi]|uniref:D-arabinono-1,4-lactone oxidase n=1 Tax=Malassezia cuniculi TaxID=948313 RepID=A0AAF0J6R7_9BASI|nr:hypothetical protein MCUN1_002376 [Malassezia cuniculi]
MPKRTLDQRQSGRGAAARAAVPAADFCTSVSAAALEAIVAPATLAPGAKDAHFTNWAQTFDSAASAPHTPRVIAPNSVEQVMAAVELARRGNGRQSIPIRAVGRLHSPSDLPFSLGWTLRTDELAGIVKVDAAALEVTALAGTYISTISEALAANKPPLGLRNLGSISEQTIAGVISTATHGTGAAFPVLSAYVTALHIVCPLRNGTQLIRCSRTERPELFNASLCGLGATGVIVMVTLAVDHAFALREVTEDVSADAILGSRPPAEAVDAALAEETFNGSLIDTPALLGARAASGYALPDAPAFPPPPKSADPAHIFPFAPAGPAAQMPDWSAEPETRAAQTLIEELVNSAAHVKLMWFPQADKISVVRAQRTNEEPAGRSLAQRAYHRVVGYHLTQLLLFISRYHRSLPPRVARTAYWLTHSSSATEDDGGLPRVSASSHITTRVDNAPDVFNMDCLFRQYTYEYAIPLEYAGAALRALRTWLDCEHANADGVRPHFPIEIRFVDADGIWLSHCYGRKTCFIGIIQFRPYGMPVAYRKFFERFEQIMRQFDGRPHWAKTHSSYRGELMARYPHMQDWLRVIAEYDPSRMLVNPYIARHLMDEHSVSRWSPFRRSRL